MVKKLEKFAVTVHHDKLDNGAHVFLFERNGMPVYLRAAFFAGSRFDERPGTAHFLEHMLLAGTKKFPSKNLIAEHIQRVGGDFSASTSNNILRFNVEIPEAQDIDIGIEILSECLTNSLFKDEVIGMERGVILSEIRSKKNNPKEYISEVQRRVSLQGTAAGRSTLGNEEDVKQITKSELVDYKNKYINSGRLSFIASGDIPMELLKKKLNSLDLQKEERFVTPSMLPIVNEKKLDIECYKGLEHIQVSFICRTNIESHREYCALRVLNSILGVGRGSRLITRLRYEKGLVYSVSTNVFDTVDWGVIRINLSCDKNNLENVKELVFQEFRNLRENNISLLELEDIKSKIVKGSVRHFQTSGSWVDFHEDDALFIPEELKTVEDYMQTVNSLELKDVQLVIDKYLVEDNFVTAICGDY